MIETRRFPSTTLDVLEEVWKWSASEVVSAVVDPRPYVNPTIAGVYWFLFLHWAVQAQFDLFPRFSGSLFDGWSSRAIAHILNPAAPISRTVIL